MDVFALREKWDIRPRVEQVDTLAAEFPAQTKYLYLTYGAANTTLPRSAGRSCPSQGRCATRPSEGRLEDEHGWNLPMKQPSMTKAVSSPTLKPSSGPICATNGASGIIASTLPQLMGKEFLHRAGLRLLPQRCLCRV